MRHRPWWREPRWPRLGPSGRRPRSVPRTWTHLLFEAAGRPIDPASPTPQSWREYVSLTTSLSAPETMTEGGQGHFDPLTAFETGYNPSDPVDRAIMATRKAVFPLHGLMP
jgi:acetoin utilization protein AcuC